MVKMDRGTLPLAGLVLCALLAARSAIAQSPDSGNAAGSSANPISVAAPDETASTFNLPGSPSSVSSSLMQLLGAQSVTDAVRQLAGVTVEQSGLDPRFEQISVRGFVVSIVGDYRDGLRQAASGNTMFRTEVFGLDSIEVWKGPSSSWYGQSSPGGALDYITKQPTSDPVREIEIDGGNLQRKQVELDLGGKLADDDDTLYRLTALGRDDRTQPEPSRDERLYVAPALTLRDSEGTSFTVQASYQKDSTTGNPDFATDASGGLTDVRTYEPSFDRFDQKQETLELTFKHLFADDWDLTFRALYGRVDLTWNLVGAQSLESDGITLDRFVGAYQSQLDSFAAELQVARTLQWLGVEHHLALGINFDEGADEVATGSDSAPSLDLQSPVYGSAPIQAPAVSSDTRVTDRQAGIYLSDYMKYGSWIVSLGVRGDHVTNETDDLLFGTASQQRDHAVTYHGGLMRLFAGDQLAAYADYATSFVPALGSDFSGKPFSPLTGAQAEVGLKFAPHAFPGLITLSAFDLAQRDVPTSDPVNPGYQIQLGEDRSRGVELEDLLTVRDGLRLGFSGTLDHSEVTRSNDTNLHKSPATVPRYQGSLWADYRLPLAGPLANLSVGAGVVYVGSSFTDVLNTTKNPATLTAQALLHYDLRSWRLAVNADNVANRRIVICSSGACYLGRPRTIIASLSYRP